MTGSRGGGAGSTLRGRDDWRSVWSLAPKRIPPSFAQDSRERLSLREELSAFLIHQRLNLRHSSVGTIDVAGTQAGV